MKEPGENEKREWERRATAKDAIVPEYWEVFPTHVLIVCGSCHVEFKRNLVLNVNDPTFVCPNEGCRRKNFVPITYDLKR